MSPLDTDKRSELLGAKLVGIARARAVAGAADGTRGRFPGGATLRLPDNRGMVLLGDNPQRGLGPALAWAHRAGVAKGQSLTVVVDVDAEGRAQRPVAEELARRLKGLSAPPVLWWIDGSAVNLPTPAEVPAGPFEVPSVARPAVAAAAAVEADVVPHAGGLVTFEILGLEVGRCWPDPSAPDGLAFKVGVGAHDREATDELHQGRPDATALAQAVDTVRAGRRAGVMPGPSSLLARERWLRADLQADPRPLGDGLSGLVPIPEPYPAPDLRVPRPAAAMADNGTLVVCSAGVDLDLVSACADAWLQAGRPAQAVVAVPVGDDPDISHRLLERLAFPARMVTVIPPWA